MGERADKFLDRLAKPSGLAGGWDLRVFWHGVPHEPVEGDVDDKDWSKSEPDPDAP
ncbi:hypothetical protein [Leifsonia shinshuensis]